MGICSSTKNCEDITTANGQDVKQIVIEAETWKRDSHGLFDYETNDVIRKTLRIAGTAQIFRETDDLQLLEFSYRKFLMKTRLLFDDSREGDFLSNTDREDLEELKEMPNEMIKTANQNSL